MTAPVLSATFPVGRFRCTLAATVADQLEATEICATWRPHPPRRLSDIEWEAYRRGRDGFLHALSDHLGKTIGVIEI